MADRERLTIPMFNKDGQPTGAVFFDMEFGGKLHMVCANTDGAALAEYDFQVNEVDEIQRLLNRNIIPF